MNEQMNMQAMPASATKKWMWLAAVAIVVLAVLGWWMWQRPQQVTAPETSEQDTTVAIEQELQATDLGDLEAELQATEADLNSLGK